MGGWIARPETKQTLRLMRKRPVIATPEIAQNEGMGTGVS